MNNQNISQPQVKTHKVVKLITKILFSLSIILILIAIDLLISSGPCVVGIINIPRLDFWLFFFAMPTAAISLVLFFVWLGRRKTHRNALYIILSIIAFCFFVASIPMFFKSATAIHTECGPINTEIPIIMI